MAVALLSPSAVLESRLAALPEGGSGCVTHEFSCLGGGSFRHDLFPSHLSSSPEAVGAGSPSISVLVLYLSSSPSLNIDPSSWGSTVLFVLLRRTRANSSSQISSRFSRTLPVEDDVIGTFLLLQWTLSLLCVRPKTHRSQWQALHWFYVHWIEPIMAYCKTKIPNFLLEKWKSSKQNAEPAFMLLILEKWIRLLEAIAVVRQEILRVLQQPTMYYGKINISQWKEAWEIPIAFRGLEQTYLKSALAIRKSAQIFSCSWTSGLTPTS